MQTVNQPSRQGRPARPAFFWQGVLILLPVVVLAGVGVWSLRQDTVVAEAQATEHAQQLADGLADRLWRALVEARDTEGSAVIFDTDRAGRLVFPPPLPAAPSPRGFDLSTLTPAQAALWRNVEAALSDADSAAGQRSAQDFLLTSPPDDFAAATLFRIGTLLGRQGHPRQAAEQYRLAVEKYPGALTASGLPVLPLAHWKWLEQTLADTNTAPPAVLRQLDALCSNAVLHPTPVTPLLLALAPELESALGRRATLEAGRRREQVPPPANVVPPWLALWDRHQQARAAFDAASLRLGSPPRRLFWFNTISSSLSSQWLLERGAGAGPQAPTADPPTPVTNSTSFPVAGATAQRRASPTGAEDRDRSQPAAPKPAPDQLSPHPGSPEDPRPRPGAPWAGLREQEWLAVRGEEKNATIRFVCLPAQPPLPDPAHSEARFERRLRSVCETLADTGHRLPDYFAISLAVAGRSLLSSNTLHPAGPAAAGQPSVRTGSSVPARPPPPALAVARKLDREDELLRLTVHLVAPERLYARQQQRRAGFSLLIGVSTLAAAIGFVSAFRAFRKQQRLSEMKSNFVSSVSHELRAPIASLRLMAESLERGKVREAGRQHEYFRLMGQEGRRLSSLIENVLDYSRLEQGRKEFDFEPTDLVALLEATVRTMEPGATEQGVLLRLERPSDFAPQPVLDARALQQALVNLLDNALKHSPHGQTVLVGLAPDRESSPDPARAPGTASAPDGWFHLYVEDHGPGIPAAEQQKIFERFYRRGSELRRETPGVGLGLTIVKHIAEAHGGRALVHSTPGQGSRFVLELPLHPCPSPPQPL